MVSMVSMVRSRGDIVPASTFRYGSIFTAVTRAPSIFMHTPMLLAVTPLPMPLMTPPVTTMNLVAAPPLAPLIESEREAKRARRAVVERPIDRGRGATRRSARG